jgi:hypothetical protein
MAVISKGDLVEFTRTPVLSGVYSVGKGEPGNPAEFGVAVLDSDGRVCKVELANGVELSVRYIHAFGWAGWIPEGLEEAHARLNNYDPDPDFEPEAY